MESILLKLAAFVLVGTAIGWAAVGQFGWATYCIAVAILALIFSKESRQRTGGQ